MIEIKNLEYVYSSGGIFEKKALHNINVKIEENKFYGLIGHTGSGKTTLVQIMAGLIKPTEGNVIVSGVDIADKKNALQKGKVGIVFQYPEHQLFEDTVFEDVAFGPKNLGLSGTEIEERVHNALITVGLDKSYYKKSPFELSGGQKRRVAIAGVLAMNPEILILDEPTAGLDPSGRDDILGKIKNLHNTTKNTVILVSHSMEDVAKTADEIMVMNKGTLAMKGSVKDVFSKAEKLQDMGLDIPEISLVIQKLADAGIDIRRDIYTIEEAKKELLKLFSGGMKNVN